MTGLPAVAPSPLDRTRVTVRAGSLVRPVLARVIGIHSARAHLPIDRLSDALLIADAIAARARDLTADGRLQLSVQSGHSRVEVRIGPLAPGGGHRLLDDAALPAVGRVVERLADDVQVRPGAAGHETLVLRIFADKAVADLPGHRDG